MKWNDIRNRVKKSAELVTTLPDKVRAVSDEPAMQPHVVEHRKKIILITGIFLVIVTAGIAVFYFLQQPRARKDFINKEQATFINEFLEQNPPQPVNEEQSLIIQQVLSQIEENPQPLVVPAN